MSLATFTYILYNGLVHDIVVHEPWEYEMSTDFTSAIDDLVSLSVQLAVEADSDAVDGALPDHQQIAWGHAEVAMRMKHFSCREERGLAFRLDRAVQAHEMAEEAHVHAMNYSDRLSITIPAAEKFAMQASEYAASVSVLIKEP